MNKKLLARCVRQIENEKSLRNMSTLDSEASIKVGSLLYTALDFTVNDDAIYESKKILESKDDFFSNFRGALQALILLRMTASRHPGSYIDSIIDTYKKLEKNSGISGLFCILSSVIIVEEHGDRDIDSVIAQVSELFGNVKKLHPERSNASELAYISLMFLSGKADARLEVEKDTIFNALKEKLQLPDDAARATSLVLMTNSKSADIKADEFVSFYNNIAATGHAAGKNQYMSIYGAYADLTYLKKFNIPESETIAAIGEVDDYLKGKTGYGMFSIKKDMRKVLAAALTLQYCTIDIPRERESEFTPEISIELLLFIVLMSLVDIS